MRDVPRHLVETGNDWTWAGTLGTALGIAIFVACIIGIVKAVVNEN